MASPSLIEAAQRRRLPFGLRRSVPALTIVCGPPGGGKSTLVQSRAEAGDLVICLDTIKAGMAKLGDDKLVLETSLHMRNHELWKLGEDQVHDRAWFIVCAADAEERLWWHAALGGAMLLVAPPLGTCIERIQQDAAREKDVQRRMAAAVDWWGRNPGLNPSMDPIALY